MSKFRFREYDALGLQRRVPGDALPVAHHISKRKQKQKNVEVVFDVKDYKEYVTGFRKRKQQRRQDAIKQIKVKERLQRNQKRSEKRTKLKQELGLGDDYGIGSSDDDDQKDERPQSVTVYPGAAGVTTTVTTMTLQSSDEEQPGEPNDSESEDEGASDQDGSVGKYRSGTAAGCGPSVRRLRGEHAGGSGGGPRSASERNSALPKTKNKETKVPSRVKRSLVKSRGGVVKAGRERDGKKCHK